MRTALIAAFLIAVHWATHRCAWAETANIESPVVATALGKKITAADIGLQYDAPDKPIIPISTPGTCLPGSPVEKLQASIMREVARDYIAKPEEIDFTPYWRKPLPEDDSRNP
jgi:hypothetical protein